MNKKRNICIIVFTSILIMFILALIFNSTCNNIEGYKNKKAYEDLSYTEKVVAKIKGYKIYTRKELINNEATKIVGIFKKIGNLNDVYNNSNKALLDDKIKQCDIVLNELHDENSSGNIIDDSLISIIDNAISAAENYKKGLNSYTKGDFSACSEFAKKSQEDILKITNEMERLGFTK